MFGWIQKTPIDSIKTIIIKGSDDFVNGFSHQQLDCPRSVANPNTALHYALERENKEALQLLVQDYFSPNNERIKNSKQQSVLLDTQGTGR